VIEQSVEHGGDSRTVSQEFAPVFHGSVPSFLCTGDEAKYKRLHTYTGSALSFNLFLVGQRHGCAYSRKYMYGLE